MCKKNELNRLQVIIQYSQKATNAVLTHAPPLHVLGLCQHVRDARHQHVALPVGIVRRYPAHAGHARSGERARLAGAVARAHSAQGLRNARAPRRCRHCRSVGTVLVRGFSRRVPAAIVPVRVVGVDQRDFHVVQRRAQHYRP